MTELRGWQNAGPIWIGPDLADLEPLPGVGHPEFHRLQVPRRETEYNSGLASINSIERAVSLAGAGFDRRLLVHLARIDIQNFRSFGTLSVDLQEGLNLVVGRNNTGKTNLLQAIRHAIGPSASRAESISLEREDFYRSSAKDTEERTITIRLTFEGLTDAQRAHFYEIVDFNLAEAAQSTAVINFEASWPRRKKYPAIKRTGPRGSDEPDVPTHILQSLPITFLPALRDAEAALAPGGRSRLALLLEDLARRRPTESIESDLKAIYAMANASLEAHPFIQTTGASLRATTKDLAGTDYLPPSVTAAEINFTRILRSLQVVMDGLPIGDLSANGLGYNNILYMAVVLEHLQAATEEESHILLIEEPEAHLHPQLTELLADYFEGKVPASSKPQTIATTHSPTLAARVAPNRVRVLFSESANGPIRCNSLGTIQMSSSEERQLQRMLDITRASLYFAKGVILVEGISEALLVPELARRLGRDLSAQHISVIPICGVAFSTFEKLLSPNGLAIPVAIVTDADPPVPPGTPWLEAEPEWEGNAFKVCDRTKRLISAFAGHGHVRVCHSDLTLEYDLALAHSDNADLMATTWEGCFVGQPGTFNRAIVASKELPRDRAMAAWRGICRAGHSGSKAEFAHQLAAEIGRKNEKAAEWTHPFIVPKYLSEAIEFVCSACDAGKPRSLATPEQTEDPKG